MAPPILLASTSPARRALMDGLGLPYQAVSPEVDEELPPGTTPVRAVRLLAERKARAVLSRHPEALVIGADQLAARDWVPLGKPPDRQAARAQLTALAGSSHDLVTGLCVVGPGFFSLDADVARLTFYPLESEELERYLDLEEWRGCAGSYRIEGAGQALVAHLEGDRTSVMGLPMELLVRRLRQASVSFFHR